MSASGCGDVQSSRERSSRPAAPLVSDDAATESSIRFLEEKVRRDPEDFNAYNKPAGYYLQRLRETGNVQHLDLASRAVRASLNSVPVVRNTGGLSALRLAEFSSHEFSAARDHALQLTQLDPAKSYPYEMIL